MKCFELGLGGGGDLVPLSWPVLCPGAADADVVSQRRKERYRQELQEQIAEQQRNKKR